MKHSMPLEDDPPPKPPSPHCANSAPPLRQLGPVLGGATNVAETAVALKVGNIFNCSCGHL